MGKNDFCCAPHCSNNRKRDPRLKFYRIPKDIKRRKVWLDRIRRQNFMPTNNTRLCSTHFVGGNKSDDPNHEAYNPSVFDFSHKKHESRKTRTSQRAQKENFVVESKARRKRSSVSTETRVFDVYS